MAQTTPAKAGKKVSDTKAGKPKVVKKQAPKNDAQEVLERMKKKEEENPDSCIFC